ncbi:MAG: anti-sigma-I factor RsgI family protein [Marvinbryantia sp.]|jgi:hypothetical protein
MKKITNSYISLHLRSAVKSLVPEKVEELWQKDVPRAEGNEWYLDGTGHRHSGVPHIVRALSAAAACMAVCAIAFYMIQLRTDATIYLDVNPSVELQINRREKVLLARADNPDGEKILDNMDLKNTDLDIAMNAILGSMVRHGYLSEAENLILLSVDSRDTGRAEELQKRLTTDIDECLVSMLGEGSILNQTLETTEELKKLSSEYQITPGKAYLLQRIIEKYPELSYEKLAKFTMNQLIPYLQDNGVDPEEFVNWFGTPMRNPETEEKEKDSEDEGEQNEEEKEESEEELEEKKEQTEELYERYEKTEYDEPEDLEELQEYEVPQNAEVPEYNEPEEYEEPEYDEPEEYEEPEYDEPAKYEEPEYDEPEADDAGDED